MPAAVGIRGTQGTVILWKWRWIYAVATGSIVVLVGGENWGVVDGKRCGGTDDGNEVRDEVGWSDDGLWLWCL